MYLIVLSVVFMIISTSVQISGWGGVNPGDSYSTEDHRSIKIQGNVDNKQEKVHFIFQVFCFIYCLAHATFQFNIFYFILWPLKYPANINLFSVNNINAKKGAKYVRR